MSTSIFRIRLLGGASTNTDFIKPTSTDSEGSYTSGSKKTTTLRSSNIFLTTRLRVWAAELVPLVLIIAIPLSVHAGVMSVFFGEPATASAPVESVPATRASDTKLLSANNSPEPSAALGGGDIIVDSGALVSSGQFGNDVVASDSLSSGEISVYTVRPGDTLSQIAEMFDVTANTILWANDINSASNIQPGDTLVILPIVGVRHIIKSGDTIETIANKYEGDVTEILSYNQLASSAELAVGETIVIPGGNLSQPTPAPKKAAASSGSASVSASAGSSNLSHPLPGAVRTQGIHGYNGVDLGAPSGTPVRAAAAGEVIISKSSGWNGGYGQYVVIKHNTGTQTLYAHMSRNDVGVGAFVSAGQTVGAVGNTGRSTGDHLHFEVRGAANPF